MKSVEDKNCEEYVEEEGDGEDAAFEVPGVPIEGCEVDVIRIKGGEEGLEGGWSWDERRWNCGGRCNGGSSLGGSFRFGHPKWVFTNLMKRKSYYKGSQRTILRSSTLIIYYRDEPAGRAFGRASANCWQGYVTKSAIFASFLNIISFKL